MKITDDYINSLFEGCNFGETINNCVKEKRECLKKNIEKQAGGHWSEHMIYQIMMYGGFIIDDEIYKDKRLTALGKLFMQE